MMKKLMAALAFVGMMLTGQMAAAEEYATADEAVAMLNHAMGIYESQGLDALLAVVNDKANTATHDRDLYLFVYDNTGKTLAHGANEKLVGKDLSKLTDQNGVLIIQEMLKVVSSGQPGWVDYSWPHPVTQQLTPKSAYVSGFDNATKFIGVGIYK